MNIVMLGAQGSGKGTVGKDLADNLNLLHISTGDIFRENIKNETQLGQEANNYISKGELVPDGLTNRILEDRLSKQDAKNGVVLDGYPRTKKQCEELDKILNNLETQVDIVVNLDVPYEELISRITNRRVCKECKEGYNLQYNPPKIQGVCDECGGMVIQREDDKPEIVEARLRIYYAKSKEVTEYYISQGKLRNEEAGEKVGRTSKDVANDLINEFNKK